MIFLFSLTATAPAKNDPIDLNQQINQFVRVIGLIQNKYISEKNYDDLFKSAINGMLTELDPHSEFLDAEKLKLLDTATTGNMTGIGAEVTVEGDFIKVISPLDESPAAKAGVAAGDIITHVDDKLVTELGFLEAVNFIRGKAGTKVELTILRRDTDHPIKITVKRGVVKIHSVKTKIVAPNIGYLRVSTFDASVAKMAKQQLTQMKTEHPDLSGLIIDVRNNPGGLLQSCVSFADLFLDRSKLKNNHLIVYVKGRQEKHVYDAYAGYGDILPNVPIVVLINAGSASAAEIVAISLQEHHRATVLGTRSFGKGSVQQVIPLGHDAAIKLTTSLYYSPLGHSIQGAGVMPDVLSPSLKMSDEADKRFLVHESSYKNAIKSPDAVSDPSHATKQGQLEKIRAIASQDFQLYHAVLLLQNK